MPTIQPAITNALKKSEILHFARVVVIDKKYIQVTAEYEGPHQEGSTSNFPRSRQRPKPFLSQSRENDPDPKGQ
ncbi:hypothetical protein HFO61_24480 [Rhizobium leguminosarum]|uniref:hypothetical protein n=1 Tax=Rhizobium leguminosarum TaxID=384 RepID=UPI001C94D4C2|nr:hypothetical protein [Rhizobium leguminosarum]MBY5549926.1 hypothetical protein [Rhizobium leguminosarum]